MFKVKNGNDFDFEAKFGGVVHRFPQGKSVLIEDAAAVHIFGIGDPDKTPYLSRHGWSRPLESTAKGLEIMNKFAFERIVPKYDVPLATDVHGAAPVGREPGAEGTDGPKASGAQGLVIPTFKAHQSAQAR